MRTPLLQLLSELLLYMFLQLTVLLSEHQFVLLLS
jgi:hypothetical protein